MQSNLEHYQNSSQDMRQQQTVLMEKQRNEYEQILSQLHEKMTLLTQEKLQVEAKYQPLEDSDKSLQSEHNKVLDCYKNTQKECGQYRVKYESQQSQAIELKKACEVKSELATTLQIKLASTDEKLSEIERQFAIANDKVQALRHAHQFISQEKANLEGQVQLFQSILQNEKLQSVQSA